MPVLYGDHLDVSQKQLLNAVAHGVVADPLSPVAGQFWYRTDLARFSWFDGTVRRLSFRLDQLDLPTVAVPMNAQRMTSMGDPVAAQDSATKAYVDGMVAGLRKTSVRVATSANTALSGLLTIDGQTLVAGDRVLVKNQTASAENGVYVAASGAWTRAVDMNTAGQVDGALAIVEDGTLAGTFWVTTSEVTTLGTDAMTWTQFVAGASYIGGAGLTLTGVTFDVVAADGSITVAADTITVGNVPIAKGGTGAATAAAARTNLAAPGSYSTSVAGGAIRTITHNLNNAYPTVTVWDQTALKQVIVG